MDSTVASKRRWRGRPIWTIAAASLCLAAKIASAQGGFLDDLLNSGSATAVFDALPREPQALADLLSEEVAALRGLEFLEPITVANQDLEEFGEYIDAEMDRSLPPERAAVYGRVVQKLGLHRGDLIQDPAALMRQLATSQVAAYYDPDRSQFFVLLPDALPILLATIYAHELYHGLQDQYWDLDAFMLDAMEAGLNDDEILARQAVVEGEATYVMNLWMMEKAMGRPPPRLLVSATVLAQSMLSSSALLDLSAGGLPAEAGAELQAAAEAMDEIPSFLLETMIGAYLKGMAFVHAVAAGGWDQVGALYDDPPRSTEQILHPTKWLERDDPVRIEFPDLASEAALDGWTVLESNVIGEFQWRIIFKEYGLGVLSSLTAAGWDGDRYAVLAREDTEELLLLSTVWDSEAEAQEFETAYANLLSLKYPGQALPTAIERSGDMVFVVEGGDRERIGDYLEILRRAQRSD
jgi:hypothetical protein